MSYSWCSKNMFLNSYLPTSLLPQKFWKIRNQNSPVITKALTTAVLLPSRALYSISAIWHQQVACGVNLVIRFDDSGFKPIEVTIISALQATRRVDRRINTYPKSNILILTPRVQTLIVWDLFCGAINGSQLDKMVTRLLKARGEDKSEDNQIFQHTYLTLRQSLKFIFFKWLVWCLKLKHPFEIP